MTELPDPVDTVRREGPWAHRDVAANGSRFHVVESLPVTDDGADGPLVVLLHGFPMFWWTWRRPLVDLPAGGYRAIAMDLRGYGGSDHPPHGYDPFTLAADVVAVVRSLGEDSAVVVGHGVGGFVAWTLGTLHPDVARAVGVVGMAHPVRLREALLHDRAQRRRARYAIGFQRPFVPERQLTAHDAALVGRILHERSATPSWPSDEDVLTYRSAMLTPATAHCAVEFHRWALRSVLRRDGRRYARAIQEPVGVPVLQVHGRHDPSILLSTVDGSEERVSGPYTRAELDCGHLPHEERPDRFDEVLQDWLRGLPAS